MQRENAASTLAAGRCLIITENGEGLADAARLHSYLSERGFEGTHLPLSLPLPLSHSPSLSLSIAFLCRSLGECLQGGTLRTIRVAIRASPARLCFLGFLGTPSVTPQRFRRLLLACTKARSAIFMLVLAQNGHEWLEAIRGLERVYIQTVVLQNDHKRRPPPLQEVASMFVTNWIRCVTYRLTHAQFIHSLRPMRPVFSDGEKTMEKTGEETVVRPLATESPELSPIFCSPVSTNS